MLRSFVINFTPLAVTAALPAQTALQSGPWRFRPDPVAHRAPVVWAVFHNFVYRRTWISISSFRAL